MTKILGKLRDFIKEHKKLTIIILSAVVLLAAATVVTVILLGNRAPDETPKTEWPEAGVYYYDSGKDEYTLTLNEGGTFALVIKGQSRSGVYTLGSDGAIVLDFAEEGIEDATATYEGAVITLTVDNSTMRFYKKIDYTVSYETNGGSSIESGAVMNGRTAEKPADPTRDGYIFVGWYLDAAFTTPFAFDSYPITADTVVYAQWVAKTSMDFEYKVMLDPNYDNLPIIDTLTTKGAQLFDLPTLTREGYEFAGWWISTPSDGDKLSYQYVSGMVLDANTTLYALWIENVDGTKLSQPVVNIESGSVKWNSVSGARGYNVKVINSDGVAVIDEDTNATTVNVPFANYPAGEYRIVVTALSTRGEANNTEAVRYFSNKALAKVSVFEVFNSTLVYNTVENAERYYVTIVCGNPGHNHTNVNNGTSRVFSFANCTMPTDGIRFTVTAVAEGYASSTSDTFVYKKVLNAVGGLVYDADTDRVSWNPVQDAAYYMVSVSCGNAAHDHGYINNSTSTCVDVRECAAVGGKITVSVYPVTKGYASPDATTLEAAKTNLATPSDIRIDDTLITWAAVEGATGYELKIGSKTYKVTDPEYDLSAIINYVEGTEYQVSIRAVGATTSLWSDVISTYYYKLSDKLEYNRSTLTWSAVIGATGYEIQVNDGEIISVSDGARSFRITLTKEGINVIKLRFVAGNHASDWISTEVFAYAINLDPRGGSNVSVQYKAIGDELDLPTPEKLGYTFDHWYNAPGGPSGNALAYTDTLFAENGAISLYAYYNPIQLTIEYNYGVGGSAPETTGTVRYECDYQLVVPTPSSVTSAFAGWFEAPYGMGTQYTDAYGKSLAEWDELEGKILYAFWVDPTLSFTKTKVNGKDGYSVAAGSAIALVEEVTVPATYKGLPVLMIAGRGFENCTNLKVLNLPSSLESLSLVDPFGGCASLEDINVYEAEGTARYSSHDGVLLYNGANGTSPASIAFVPLGKTGTYRLPDGLAEVSAESFKGSAISKIIIPTSVTKIGEGAFSECKSLTSVVFEVASGTQKNLTIAARAFAGCTRLDSITLPSRLTEINLTRYSVNGSVVDSVAVNDAFFGCTSLSEINISSANKTYKSIDGIIHSYDGKTLLYCPLTKSGSVTVTSGVQSIAPGAFVGCSLVDEVKLPNTLNYVGECAFYGTKISSVTFKGSNLGTGVTVGKYAFRGCTALSNLTLEPGSRITTISEGAFMDCTSIPEIELPASLKLIGKDAFRNCTGIRSIAFAENSAELTFEENAFSGCTGLEEIELPNYVSEIPSVFAGCVNIKAIIVSDDNPYFEAIDGVLYNETVTELVFFPRAKTGTYEIPQTVKIIGDGVFYGVTSLTRLVLPSSLELIGDEAFRYFKITDTSAGAGIFFYGTNDGTVLTIGDYAFANCYVPAIELPSNTKILGDYCFYRADVYKTAFDLKNNTKLESIGKYAFVDFMTYCTTDSESDAQKFTITIPGSVKVIGAYAFYDNKMVNVKLNEGLEVIGEGAFMNTLNITTINIPTSVTTIEYGAFQYSSGLQSLTFNPIDIQTNNISQLKTIGAYAFAETAIKSVTIPKSVTEIGACAFSDCYNLLTVTFEKGGQEELLLGTPCLGTELDPDAAQWVTVILRGRVFQNCIALQKVTLPARLTEIYPYTFYTCCSPNEGECTSALTVTFEENSRLAVIGEYAFYNCHLQSIEIPASVRNLDPVVNGPYGISYDRLAIGAYAFGRDTSCSYGQLTSVTFAAGGTGALTIGEYAFYGARFTEITLPARLAPYTSYNGNVIEGLANGVHVFERATNFAAIHIGDNDKGRYYSVKDGILYNADYTELLFAPISRSGKVTIPATVRKIHESAFLGCINITEIVVEEGSASTVIGDNAFNGCTGLLSLTLPNNVTHLGANALKGCSSLTTLTLSKNLENFEYSMIIGCDSLKDVITPDGMAIIYSDNGVLYTGDKETLIYYPPNREGTTYTVLPGTKFIAEDAFRNNSYLQTVILPEGLIEIKANAFYGAKSLVAIEIPNSLEVIGKGAFQSSNLTTLTFKAGGNAALVIDNNAFAGSRIRSVELPARLVVLGNYAFSGVSTLQDVTFAEGCRLTSIGSYTFQQTGIREFVLPDEVVSMGSYNFYSCSSLVSFTFNSSIKTIGDGNLERTGIKEIYIPATLTSMGVNNFAYCAGLATVTFSPDTSLTSIPAGTFAHTAIKDIRIPAVIRALGDKIILEEDEEADESAPTSYGVFEGCSSLQRVDFASGTNCSILGAAAFSGCTSLRSFDIPGSVVELGESLFANCTGLTEMTIPHTVTKLGKSVFSGCRNISEVELLTRTTELPAGLFSGCSSITNITIPTNVSHIGEGCFSGTSIASFDIAPDNRFINKMSEILYNQDWSVMLAIPPKAVLTSITFPKGLLEIAPSTFAGVNTLVEIKFEEDGTNPLTIGAGAFSGCTYLSLVTLPARLETIGANAFQNCVSLISINLPENLTSIGLEAFSGCQKLIEIRNESSLHITPGVVSGNGNIAHYVKHVYTPANGGQSIINIDDDGYITARFDPFIGQAAEGNVYNILVGYIGNEKNLVIPVDVDGIYTNAFHHAGPFESIYIPDGAADKITPISSFENCGDPIIFFEADSIPSAWYFNWNSGNNEYILGYDFNEHTYTFNTDIGGPIESITTKYDVTIPVLKNQGDLIFVGWYDNPEFTGKPVTGQYYSKDKTQLYAKWMPAEVLYAGVKMEYAFDLVVNAPVEIVIDDGGERVYYKFTVTDAGKYYIYTYNVNAKKDDTVGYLYDENGNLIEEATYGFTGHWSDFGIEIELDPGTYYIASGYGVDKTGSYTLVVSTTMPGSDMEHAYMLKVDDNNYDKEKVVIDEEGERVYYQFIITKDGTYRIYTTGTINSKGVGTIGYLYDEDGNLICEIGSGLDESKPYFDMEIELDAGIYYLASGYRDNTKDEHHIFVTTVKPQ